jgi:hypothetical protein
MVTGHRSQRDRGRYRDLRNISENILILGGVGLVSDADQLEPPKREGI